VEEAASSVSKRQGQVLPRCLNLAGAAPASVAEGTQEQGQVLLHAALMTAPAFDKERSLNPCPFPSVMCVDVKV
jgi:hypothetical protein